jgi:hypothetical protein
MDLKYLMIATQGKPLGVNKDTLDIGMRSGVRSFQSKCSMSRKII